MSKEILILGKEAFDKLKPDVQRFIKQQSQQITDLEAKLAESEKKLNQYPYKNDVVEKQYEELKNGIKFRIENKINDDWEQHYHCIDVLCEKYKERIRDIEDGICRIEQLEQQLAMQENTITNLVEDNRASQEWYKKQLEEKETRIAELEDKDWYEETIKQLEEQNERLIKERDNANDQNKRVLEKLELIVRSNQELEKENDDLQDKLHSYYEQIMNKGTCGLCEYVRTDYKIKFAIEILDRVSQEFSMRVGISDNNIDTLNDIMEEMVSILNGNK